MSIDITIYDNNDEMIMGYYNEDAKLEEMHTCIINLTKAYLNELNKQLKERKDGK